MSDSILSTPSSKSGTQTPTDQGKPETSEPPSNRPWPETRSFTLRAWRHMTESVRICGFVELELLLLTFCTGIQDAISFPDYRCFASNQTGNTVFLLVGAVVPSLNGNGFYMPNIGASLGFFLLGCWVTGQLSHIVGPRMRLWLVCCNLVQSILVLTAGALQFMYGVQPNGPMAVTIIALLAFASGSQVVQARSMKMTEITTAMATAAWLDVMMDPKLFHRNNRPRTRRVLFLLALATGSVLGAGIYRVAGSAVAVFVSAGGKLAVTIMYLFNGAEKPSRTDGTRASC